MATVTSPMLAEIAVITFRDVRNGSNVANPIPHLPLPSQYVSVFVIYGLLGFLPDTAQNLAATIGWGFVVATLLNLWEPGKTANTGKVTA